MDLFEKPLFDKTWVLPYVEESIRRLTMETRTTLAAGALLAVGALLGGLAIPAVVQDEPNSTIDPETLGLLPSIGIEKGKPFASDGRMKKILTEAAAVGNATSRAISFRPRN